MSTPERPVRVRFCPSPTGKPHVGLVRTALYNWVFARRWGGKMVFRIEDTDAARDSQESYEDLLDALRWLKLDWDEGVEVDGPHAPYRQSQRGELYADVLTKLKATGKVYECYSTPAEVEARHLAAGRDPKLGYDNFDRDLTDEQIAEFQAEGRKPVLRVQMPDSDCNYTDLIRGEMSFPAGTIPDFVIARADGSLLYTFTNPVDDALMGITHVLRGEDLLSSTPRQIALYGLLMEAGVTDFVPEFAHLPLVTGDGNKKLSKRDPRSNLFHHRDAGMIPEGLLNYLALLGWSIGPDRDVFSLEEMTQSFDITQVNGNAARFDDKKAIAINAEHLRLLDEADFAGRLVPYLQSKNLVGSELTEPQQQVLDAVAPLIQTRIQVLSEAPEMVGFLFTADADHEVTDAAKSSLRAEAGDVLVATEKILQEWDGPFAADSIQQSLREALVDGQGLKPKFAFGPVRVAISGRKISPPLFESMEILGKESSLARVQALRESLA